jgi:UDP-N-acetylglucosamine diphosphorylase/glucosamine-1-phosphate N-acetyltransferase
MQLVVFDSELRRNFEPLSLTRPTFEFLLGTQTLLERIEMKLERKATSLIVPKHLELMCQEIRPSTKRTFQAGGVSILVNGLVSPNFDLSSEVKQSVSEYGSNFAVVNSGNNVIFAVTEETSFTDLSNKTVLKKLKRVPINGKIEPLLTYPWHLVVNNEKAIEQDYDWIRAKGEIVDPGNKNGIEMLGEKHSISESADLERFVTLDSRKGPIILDAEAVVQSFSYVTGPCYIGKGTIIKSARVGGGTSIGDQCRIGGEVEASLIHDYTNKNHEGFLGHSFVGSWVNLGALTTNSDLKNTYGNIRMKVNRKEIDTGLNKVGCFVSDMCKTSIGTLILSGKSIGVGSNIFGVVEEDVPSFTLYAKSLSAKSAEIYLDSSIETQTRMMERRKIKISEGYKQMITAVYKMTASDRRASQVRRRKFKL